MSTSPTSGSGPGSPLRIAELFALLPPVAELRPFLDLLIGRSVADPERRWSGSGELGTVGDRLVETAELETAARGLVVAEQERIEELIGRAAAVVEALGRADWDRAAEVLLEQGGDAENRGRVGDAEGWYMAAYGIARDRGLARTPRALRLAARVARAAGRLSDAAERYEEAWRDASDLELEDDMVVSAIGRGNVEVDRGRWAAAREWYERALAFVGEEGPPRRERWQIYQNLSIVHRQGRRLDEARRCLERAETEGGRLDDPDVPVEVGNGWGKLRFAEGEPRAAELHFERALEAARDPRARVAIEVNLGEAVLAQGRALEAAEHARRAEAEALTGSVTGKLPEVYRLLAATAHARGETEAFVFLERALELIRERGLPSYEEALTREVYGRLRIELGEEERGRAEVERASELFRRIGAERATAVGTDAGEAAEDVNPEDEERGDGS